MNKPTLRNQMLWNAVGNVIYLGCQWLVVVLVTKMGGFSDAGLLSIAMSVSATFQTIALFGIRNFQVSDLKGEFSDTHYVGFRTITCTLALLICMGFSLIARYRSWQLLAILLFMLFRLAESFSDVLHGIAQKNDRLDIAGKSFAIKGVGLLAVFYISYRFMGNLCFSLLLMAAFSLSSTFLFDLFIVRRFSRFALLANPANCVPMAKKTIPLCLYMFLYSAISTVPKLFLERQTDEAILGAYSSVFAPALLITSAAGYLYQPFISTFTKYHQAKERKKFLILLSKIGFGILLVGVLALILEYFLGEFALMLIFGEMIRDYVYLFQPIILAIFFVALMSFLSMLEIVLRDFLWLLIGCGIGFAIEIAVSYPMVRIYGANGASFALLLAAGVAVVVLLFRIIFHCGIHEEAVS
ncbi:MAG: lipopolysaccharide biosynthesis protein [Clostridia bacterium]|nr:lipopolysaccharide biosynthesis protein [Clostridia bacterium]